MLARYFEVLEEKCFNYEKAMNRQGLKQEWVDKLREMVKRSQYVPKVIDDRFLLVFVNNCRDDIEQASKWLHTLFKLRAHSPEFYGDRNTRSIEFRKPFETCYFAILPNTPDNHFVFYHALRDSNPRNYNFDNGVKVFLMMLESKLLSDGPMNGAIYVMDLKGVRFNHIFCPSVHSVRKGLEFLQTANPVRIKAVHVINSFWFMDLVFAMIRPFLRKEFYERIHLHPVGSDLSKLFETDVPRSIMPKDLGGECETIQYHHDKTLSLIEGLHEYFYLETEQAKLNLDDYVNSEEYKYRHFYIN